MNIFREAALEAEAEITDRVLEKKAKRLGIPENRIPKTEGQKTLIREKLKPKVIKAYTEEYEKVENKEEK